MNQLEAMFQWWNNAFADRDGFTPENLGRFFTSDCVMKINGQIRAEGLAGLAARFQTVQSEVDHVEIHLPFEEGFEAGDRIFTHHLVSARKGAASFGERVMGYAILRDGKLALLDFLSIDTTA